MAMSGGKALRGPQSSGYLFGRRELVASALLQQLDMDDRSETWVPPRLVEPYRLEGMPRHGFGRGFKVGKEEIAGAVAAVRDFADHSEEYLKAWEDQCLFAATELEGLPGLRVDYQSTTETGRVPLLLLEFEEATRARQVSIALRAGDPAVHLNERWLDRGRLVLNPVGLAEGQERLVAERVRSALADADSGTTTLV
ncbi:MAG: hypothetical protein WD273_05675 [Trueperaceae bacterium]